MSPPSTKSILVTLSLSSNPNCYIKSVSAGKIDAEVKLMVPNGAAEQEGVLEDDGQARPEGLQRQLSDVDVVNHNPSCKKKTFIQSAKQRQCVLLMLN